MGIQAAEISKLERGLRFRVPTSPVSVQFILSVMDIEAWFIAEHLHFDKIDPRITCDAIASTLGFDPRTDDISQRPRPADDLNACYAIGDKSYLKGSRDVIGCLDFASIYLSVAKRFAYLHHLCRVIEDFLAA